MPTAELRFASGGAECAATVLRAAHDGLRGPAGVPGVVLAHGFGCTRDSGLMPYAERFAAAGFEVLLFDYRGFGTSGGRPRQVVSHRRQRADYHAAVRTLRGREGVDPTRIAVWGTSYSGGHVVAVAARDPRIAAVVSQGAALDGLAVVRGGSSDPFAPRAKGPRMAAAALRDAIATGLRRPPRLVAAIGGPGEFAMLTDPHTADDFLAMTGPSWRNEIAARSLFSVPFNRPVRLAAQVRCPVLFVVAEQDTIASPAIVRAAAARMPAAEVLALDCPHFGIYSGAAYEHSVDAQVRFLQHTLGRTRVRRSSTGAGPVA